MYNFQLSVRAVLMKKEIEDSLAQEQKRLDELFFQLGDVLDVKASIILVVITFLGTISSQVLVVPNLPNLIKGIQIIAVLALGFGLVATVWSLWPRAFEAPQDAAEWLDYLQKLEKHYAGKDDTSELVAKDFSQDMARRRQDRITRNRALAKTKAKFNNVAFRATVVAASAEAVSLVWLVFSHLLKVT